MSVGGYGLSERPRRGALSQRRRCPVGAAHGRGRYYVPVAKRGDDRPKVAAAVRICLPLSGHCILRGNTCHIMNGRFYFKLTSNGNLIGEFSNDHPTITRSHTESADRITSGVDPFEGDYFSTWHEQGQAQAELSKLIIKTKSGCHNLYTVIWEEFPSTNTPIKIRFKGEAMLCDNILIGNYR